MTSQHSIDPAEAARITQDIRDTSGFLEDLIDDPSLADLIPSGSTLAFRTIQIRGERFRLVAFRPSRSNEGWSSRVVSREAAGDRASTHPPLGPPMRDIVLSGQTAEDALDALEAMLNQGALAPHNPPHRRHR